MLRELSEFPKITKAGQVGNVDGRISRPSEDATTDGVSVFTESPLGDEIEHVGGVVEGDLAASAEPAERIDDGSLSIPAGFRGD